MITFKHFIENLTKQNSLLFLLMNVVLIQPLFLDIHELKREESTEKSIINTTNRYNLI